MRKRPKQHYEYRFSHVDAGEELIKRLDRMGEEGWRLVSTHRMEYPDKDLTQVAYALFWERPVVTKRARAT